MQRASCASTISRAVIRWRFSFSQRPARQRPSILRSRNREELCILFETTSDRRIGSIRFSSYAALRSRAFLGRAVHAFIRTEPPRRLALYPFSVRGLHYCDVELVARGTIFATPLGGRSQAICGAFTVFTPALTWKQLVRIGEEWELQERLWKAGVRDVYLPDAGIRHRIRAEQTSMSCCSIRTIRWGSDWHADAQGSSILREAVAFERASTRSRELGRRVRRRGCQDRWLPARRAALALANAALRVRTMKGE